MSAGTSNRAFPVQNLIIKKKSARNKCALNNLEAMFMIVLEELDEDFDSMIHDSIILWTLNISILIIIKCITSKFWMLVAARHRKEEFQQRTPKIGFLNNGTPEI